ncbi:MAG: S9 family peptidase [Gemmatimonadetes bacterium]|nr:S9 family peptidase [Gemmatimonadota bacterium]
MKSPFQFAAASVALAVLGAAAGSAVAQETPSDTLLTVQHYLNWEQVADPQISPDGSQIVYARRWINQLEDRWDSALWLMNADGTKQRFLLKGGSPRWSPDGTRIAYIAEADGKAQIFVRWMDAEGAVSQVTRLAEAPGNLAWSPDGKWLSFSMSVPYDNSWRISMPAAPAGAKWTPAPRRVTDLHYRQDRAGFMALAHTHLFVVPADGGTPRQVTKGEFDVGAKFDALNGGVGYDWTPDSKQIVFDGHLQSNWDLNYRNSDLHIVDVATGQMRKLTSRTGTWTDPSVSPDGKTIAYAGYDSTRKSYKTSELYFMGIDGGNPRLASGDLDRDVGGMVWAEDGSGVYFGTQDKGTANLYFAALRGGVRQVTTGNHMLGISSISKTGIAVGTRSAYHEPGDVVRLALARPTEVTRLTDVNGDVLARIKLGAVEEIWYTSTGGARVQGWIVKPPNFDRSRKYPLIMEIHGGPHGMYNVGFSYMYQNFAANGNVVLYTNPRGSTGYGTGFGNAIERAYPSVDYEDLMAGVDSVIGRGYIDTSRMYVGGCSGGGVLSSWVVGHTTRFAAAAVRCPVINWLSFSGQADVPLFTGNFFDKPFWEDPGPWLKQSPLMYVKNVKTPTLLMTGELDLRTPMPQTEEYFAALKMLGVPTEILRFAGEYHGTSSKPSNFIRTQLYMMSWYQKYANKTGPATMP